MIHLEHLRRRAELLDRLRAFFKQRGFLEVETPLAAREAIPEQHIQLSQLDDGLRWLQASPEMHHKRLLAAGSGPIFEVTKSFRSQERGERHSPEFTIVEWYRPGDDLSAGMALVDQLLQTLLDAPAAKRTTYREAFKRALAVDPHAVTLEELQSLCLERIPEMAGSLEAADRDECLNALLSFLVEPTLGAEQPELLYHYPVSQAALATTALDDRGVEVAERFELYWRGVELANGYHELTDPVELRRRLELANAQRVAAGAAPVPMPERLLVAMTDPGLPPCAGLALGFDRLVMLATGAETIAEVRPFADEL